MSDPSQRYCLRWNNYRVNIMNVFDDLLQSGSFTDVTIAVDCGSLLKCHKIVLAACSTYFQNLFLQLGDCATHPIVVLKDVQHSEFKAILEYMYRGEVNVAQRQLSGLLKVAEALKVKGLMEVEKNFTEIERLAHHERGDLSHCEEMDRLPDRPMSMSPAISTSTGGGNNAITHSGGHASPPHSSTGGGVYGLYKSTVERHFGHNLPLWPGPLGFSPAVTASGQPAAHSAPTYDSGSGYETSHKRSRKMPYTPTLLMSRLEKTDSILRHKLLDGHVDSSQNISRLLQSDSHEPVHFRSASNNVPTNGNDNHRSSADFIHGDTARSPCTDVFMDEDEKQPSPQSYLEDVKSGTPSNYASPKPEWKRYKQYTRDDISAAINAVKQGMSAVQAARKYGVPSRTLYDKVKKLGIPTSRPPKRAATNGGNTTVWYRHGGGGGSRAGGGGGGSGNANANGSIYGSGGQSETGENGAVGNISVTDCTAADTLIAAYAAKKDSLLRPQNRDSLSSSPVIRCAKSTQQQHHNLEDQVEDLSVNRKSDVPMIVSPSITTSDAIKSETQESEQDSSD